MTTIDTTRCHIDPDTLDGQVPACVLWPIPDERVLRVPASEPPYVAPRLNAWQKGRCAICGDKKTLVLDHSHITGKIRGHLCRSCNQLEGHANGPMYTRYRAGWNPATLLGVDEEYRSPFHVGPVLSFEGEYLRMSREERAAYDARMTAVMDSLFEDGAL